MNKPFSHAFFHDGVMLDVSLPDMTSVATQLALNLVSAHRVSQPIVVKNAILNRERLASTYVDHGLAMPHFMSSSVKQSSIVFMRLASPIWWDPLDAHSQVRLILCLALTKSPPMDILRLCSQLACASLDPGFCQQLLDCQTSYSALRVLSQSL